MAFLGGCSLVATSPASAQSRPGAVQGDTRRFSIQPQPLSAALDRFAEQAGVAVTRTVEVSGLQSPGIAGEWTPAAALQRLLAGTGVTFQFSAAGAVTVQRAAAGTSDVQQLEPVVVSEQGAAPKTGQIGNLPPAYAGGQVARGGRIGLLGNRDIMDTPFSTTSFTAKTVQDQQAVTTADVVQRDPSIRSAHSSGGILDAFFVRGFAIGEGNAGEIALNGVFGVAPNYRVLTDYAERIEVVKGPTALLYGMSPNSSVGGTINIVPKRATDEDLTRLTTSYSSDAQFGGSIDFGRRFGDNKEFGVRLNLGYHDGATPMDKQSRQAFVGALALDYRGERFRASLDFISQVEKFDAPARPFVVAPGVSVPQAPSGRRNITDSWERSKNVERSTLLQLEYDISDSVTVFASGGWANTTVDRLSQQLPTILNTAGDTSAVPMYFKFEVKRLTAEAGARASFDTGALHHTATAQFGFYHELLFRGSTAAAQPVLSNIYRPADIARVNLSQPTRVPKVSQSDLAGFAFADTVSFLDNRVQLTLGGRYQLIASDNFDANTGRITTSSEKSALTPMVGLVVKPWKNVSVYANYVQGLSRGDIAPATAANAGEALDPYVAKQYEVGVKADFGRLVAVVSAFQIEKPFGQLVNNVFSAGGRQRNRGLEFSLFGEVVDGVRLFGGVTVLDAALTKTNSSATKGNRPVGVPKMQANLSAEWDVSFVPGLTLAGSLIYTGSEYVNVANTQRIPAWATVDLGARYGTTIAGTPVTLRATVKNVFDKGYWSGVASSYSGLMQGAPRTFLLSISTDLAVLGGKGS